MLPKFATQFNDKFVGEREAIRAGLGLGDGGLDLVGRDGGDFECFLDGPVRKDVDLQLGDSGEVVLSQGVNPLSQFSFAPSHPEQRVGLGHQGLPFLDGLRLGRGQHHLPLHTVIDHILRELLQVDLLDVEIQMSLGPAAHGLEDLIDRRNPPSHKLLSLPRTNIEFLQLFP